MSEKIETLARVNLPPVLKGMISNAIRFNQNLHGIENRKTSKAGARKRTDINPFHYRFFDLDEIY